MAEACREGCSRVTAAASKPGLPIVIASVRDVLVGGEARVLPVGIGAQRASANGYRSLAARTVAILATAFLFAMAAQLAPLPSAVTSTRAVTPAVPKAVFIVGPTNGLTSSNLTDAEKMSEQAEASRMEVHRVFFPHATWDNVLANIQDANLVVYMGHGYGWPSPYTNELTESRQDGMALNSFDGSGQSQYTYYGAAKLVRASISPPMRSST